MMKNVNAKSRSTRRNDIVNKSLFLLLVNSFILSGNSLQSHVSHYMKDSPSATRVPHQSHRLSPMGSGDVQVQTALAASTTDESSSEKEENAGNKNLAKNSSIVPGTKKKYMFNSFQLQLDRRIAADPNFISKSVVEIALAAGTQVIAESGRRGPARILPEIDFVFAGVLTAVAGKYYSMWRVAPTKDKDGYTSSDANTLIVTQDDKVPFWSRVPTNAFQDDCSLSITHRLAAFLKPIPPLFRAGIVASAIGYGFTSVLIFMRGWLMPSYVAETKMVNIPFACVYTGSFMALVSNIRYQLLSGIIEPKFIDRYFGRFPPVHATLILLTRLANGILGSMLAISGMKRFGLQRLK